MVQSLKSVENISGTGPLWTVGQAVRVNDLLGGLCSAQSL